MAEESLQGVVVCSLDVNRAPGKALEMTPKKAELSGERDGDMLGGTLSQGAAAGDNNSKLKPLMLVAAADMYSLEPKPASVAGGIMTVLALVAAIAYTVSQVVNYTKMPPVVTSFVEWSDTKGPFPARIRCTAPSGCWVSNRHNDIWSSHGEKVEAAQQGCLVLQPGQEYTMNFTFTQQPLNGFVAIWDPATWENGTTPGSGLQLLAETNAPAAPNGVFMLATPVLGGTYLANYVETHNNSAPVAKLRQEWLITYASSEKHVLPAATACAGQLTQQQLVNYHQAIVRMQAAWYRVTVEPPDLLLTLVGNCGGALQLFLQAGCMCLLAFQFMRNTVFRKVSTLQPKLGQQQQQQQQQQQHMYVDADGIQQHNPCPGLVTERVGYPSTELASATHVQGYSTASQLSLHSSNDGVLVLSSPGGAQLQPAHEQQQLAATDIHGYNQATAGHSRFSWLAHSRQSADGEPPATHSQPLRDAFSQMVHSLGRGMAASSMSGSGASSAALRGASSGGGAPSGVNAGIGARLPPGLITSSAGTNSNTVGGRA